MQKPVIRFKEFTENYKERILKDISFICDGIHFTPKYTNEGVPFFSAEDIENINNCNKFISDEDYKTFFTVRPKKDDIFITKMGNIGKALLLDKDYDCGFYVSVVLLRAKEYINGKYLKSLIETPSVQHIFKLKTIHQAFPKKINLKEIEKVITHIPSKLEQDKIADFLANIDNMINIQQRKTKLLKEYKNGLRDKLFAFHFSHSNIVTLSSICSKINVRNLSNDYTNILSNSSKYGIIARGEYFKQKNHSDGEYSKYTVIEKGDFVYNPRISSNAPCGPINCYTQEPLGIVSPLYLCFRNTSKTVQTCFLVEFFKSSLWHNYIFKNNCQGIRFDRINIKASIFYKMPVCVPTSKDQTFIVNILSSYETKINLEEQKLNLYNNLKNFLLSYMFI